MIKPWMILSEFPQAMNYIVMRLLCDQFDELNQEFGKCIGDRGEFHGNFEQYRRRHHAICRSVQEADRFLMITNVACFGCNIAGFIVILYIAVFYTEDTVTLSAQGTALIYIFWLASCACGLCLAAGQAILLNHKVSTVDLHIFLITTAPSTERNIPHVR